MRDLRRQLDGLPRSAPADAMLVIAGGNDILIDLHELAIRGNGRMQGTTHLSFDIFDEQYSSDDGLHPNDRGYAVLADYAWPQIARAMGVALR